MRAIPANKDERSVCVLERTFGRIIQVLCHGPAPDILPNKDEQKARPNGRALVCSCADHLVKRKAKRVSTGYWALAASMVLLYCSSAMRFLAMKRLYCSPDSRGYTMV